MWYRMYFLVLKGRLDNVYLQDGLINPEVQRELNNFLIPYFFPAFLSVLLNISTSEITISIGRDKYKLL